MADASANSLSTGLRNVRRLLRDRCGCHGTGADVSGPPAAPRIRLDTFGSGLSGGRSCGFLDMGRSGERHDVTVDARNPAGRLDETAQSMGIHARRACGSSDCCTRYSCVLNTRRNTNQWFQPAYLDATPDSSLRSPLVRLSVTLGAKRMMA
jgi:hypothetical protein